ncbi:YpjP family protein [Bhargavaea ullalensis]|uniref:YpjP-like protein n=1 Tax=Bhargavaea ullalensis TaxID=1265685 RepID=A0ABV2G9F1_9BACL
MKKWIQKSLMVGVALLTLGFIPPSHEMWDSILDDKGHREISGSAVHAEVLQKPEMLAEEPSFTDMAKVAAKDQAFEKFGNRIGPVISDEFESVILPKIEEAIDMTLVTLGPDAVRDLAITERPAGGYSEKIFHIFDRETGKDVIRFHVRTDKRPLDGYYFNFHYHTAEDGFSRHIALGDIYWSKNTPPKWLS